MYFQNFIFELKAKIIMTHNELEYLITIYDTGNFSLAAKKLYISQSALSQSIQKLEKNLNISLFIRSNTGVKPTPFCQQLVDLARPISNQWNQFMQDVNQLVENQQSELVVGMNAFLMKNLASSILSIFQKKYPQINLKLVEERTQTLEYWVKQGILNFCIEFEPLHDITLDVIPLCTTELFLAVPKEHPFCIHHPYQGLDHLETINPLELQHTNFALLNHHSTAHLWNKLYSILGFEPEIRQSAYWTNIKDYIQYDSCVGFLNEIMVNHEPTEERISYYRISSKLLSQRMVAAFSPCRILSPQELWFIETAKEAILQNCPTHKFVRK